MKIFKNLVFVMIMLFAAGSTYANNYPTLNLKETKILVVDLNDWKTSDLEITIKDDNSEILFVDFLKAGQLKTRKYDLRNLEEGRYLVVINGGKKVAEHSFTVRYNKVSLTMDASKVYFRPSLKVKSDFIELNHLALGSDVQISISDASGVFFVKKYKNMSSINTKFDISNLPAGEYAISVSTKDQYESLPFAK